MNDDNSEIEEILYSLGLSRPAATTYLALLGLESVSIRKVSQQTGINRGTTYELIKKLIAAGLVSVKKTGQREYFTSESPEKIYDIIRDKRKRLLEVSESAKAAIPSILARKVRPQGGPLVRYFEDDEGVVTILKDVLQTCRALDTPEYCAYSSRAVRQYLYRKFPNFTKRRIAEGIMVKVIGVGEGGETTEVSERKWLPESLQGSISSYTLIYGNKVALISISKDYTPYGVVIEDSGAASMQRLLFEQLWKRI
jgi:sugar-specific transcriptional regulator TrmB